MAHNTIAETKALADLTPDQLFQEATKAFKPKAGYISPDGQPAYLPDPTDAARTVICLALSGRGFGDLYGDTQRTASDFLFDTRRSIHRRDSAAGHLLMPFDGSDATARRDLQEAFAGQRPLMSALSCALAESALSSCDINALRGVIGSKRGDDNKAVEDRFLDRVAESFVAEAGPLRHFTFAPRQPAAVTQG